MIRKALVWVILWLIVAFGSNWLIFGPLDYPKESGYGLASLFIKPIPVLNISSSSV